MNRLNFNEWLNNNKDFTTTYVEGMPFFVPLKEKLKHIEDYFIYLPDIIIFYVPVSDILSVNDIYKNLKHIDLRLFKVGAYAYKNPEPNSYHEGTTGCSIHVSSFPDINEEINCNVYRKTDESGLRPKLLVKDSNISHFSRVKQTGKLYLNNHEVRSYETLEFRIECGSSSHVREYQKLYLRKIEKMYNLELNVSDNVPLGIVRDYLIDCEHSKDMQNVGEYLSGLLNHH